MNRTEPASPSHLLRPLLLLVRERGGVLDLADLGLTGGPTGETPVAARTLGKIFDAAARALDEPHLGLLLPQALKFSRYELPELAARSSPDLREAMRRLTRYSPLLSEAVTFGFEEVDGVGRFTQHSPGHPRGLSRHLNEFAMAMGVHECFTRTGLRMKVREVCFINPRPRASLEALTAYFGTEALRFGHLHNTLVFEGAVLDAPQLTADPRLLETAQGLADEAMRKRNVGGTGFRVLVERSVREQLEKSNLSIRSVALGLRMSTRTLQRRLESEGTRFAEVLDQMREVMARERVTKSEPSLSEIAFELGFAEFATFSRAFKRWTGSPPGAFRQEALRRI